MSTKGLPTELQGTSTRIPSFAFPEQAAIAMARASTYGCWRERVEGKIPVFADLRPDDAGAVIVAALGRSDEWLEPNEVDRVLASYGLRTARTERARDADQAAEAAARMGSPVALKAFGPDLLHKTEVGAVALGLTAGDVGAAAREIAERVLAAGFTLEGFVVQEMVERGVEMLVGVANDRSFGPVVAVGAGGTTVELLRDVAVRVTPITDLDAEEMVRSLATFPLLDGFRGAPKADVASLEETVLRVSALADNHPAIAEMDCNPVIVGRRGSVIVDARVRVRRSLPARPLSARA
jgi:acyl-CoA synthetase (NDP forming)